jgi:hypothetical protein
MHFIVWEPGRQILTQADVPLALMRLNDEPMDILRFVDNPREPRHKAVSLRMSDLDRFGPSLLVDQRSEDGHRVLVWTD